MKRYCFAIDLVNDAQLIEEYKAYHHKVWPEILTSIKESGIDFLEIYCINDRLFMIMEVNDTFNLDTKAEMDANSAIVQEWETLMWKYQKALPGVEKGVKWVLMDKIFQL